MQKAQTTQANTSFSRIEPDKLSAIVKIGHGGFSGPTAPAVRSESDSPFARTGMRDSAPALQHSRVRGVPFRWPEFESSAFVSRGKDSHPCRNSNEHSRARVCFSRRLHGLRPKIPFPSATPPTNINPPGAFPRCRRSCRRPRTLQCPTLRSTTPRIIRCLKECRNLPPRPFSKCRTCTGRNQPTPRFPQPQPSPRRPRLADAIRAASKAVLSSRSFRDFTLAAQASPTLTPGWLAFMPPAIRTARSSSTTCRPIPSPVALAIFGCSMTTWKPNAPAICARR